MTFYVYSGSGGVVVGAIVTVTDSSGDHVGSTGDRGSVTLDLSKTDESFAVSVTATGFCPIARSVTVHDNPRWDWIGLSPGC
jgi:hypothetical protein